MKLNFNSVPGNNFLDKHYSIENYEDDLSFLNVPGNKYLNKHFNKQRNTKIDYKCVENSECAFNLNNQGCSVKNECVDGNCYYAGKDDGCVSLVNK